MSNYVTDIHTEDVTDLFNQLHAWQLEALNKNCIQYYRGQNLVADLKPSVLRHKILNEHLPKFTSAEDPNPQVLNNTIKMQIALLNQAGSRSSRNRLGDLPDKKAKILYKNAFLRRFEKFLIAKFFHLSNDAGLKTNYTLHTGLNSQYEQNVELPRPLTINNHPQYGQCYFGLLDSQSLSICFGEIYSGNLKISPMCSGRSSKYLEIVSLAQHHGIPTRLLDFTKSSMKAAFFSAYKANENKSDDKRIAIYKVRITNADQAMIKFVDDHDKYLNKFLFAQEGLFAHMYIDHFFLTKFEWPSLEDLAIEYGGIEVSRITFPRDKSVKLLDALKKTYNISVAKMIPHYDSIKEDLFLELNNGSIKL